MLTQDRLNRDLDWCLHSPPLVTDPDTAFIWPDERWFRQLNRETAIALPEPRHPHHFRLGQHFEKLLVAWLEASTDFELLAANLQVQDGKRTVGEFDFLVQHQGVVEHWEAAVKFYLGTGTGTGETLDCWYGPNTADRFDIKYERLINHQLGLANNEYAQLTLAQRHIGVDRARCFMKGRLFYPWAHFENRDFRFAPIIHPGHEKGWWLPQTDFLLTFEDTASRFVYLPKSLWLSPLTLADFEAPLSCWELMEFLESPHIEQATHVAIVSDDGEISRGFIVKDQWLDRLS